MKRENTQLFSFSYAIINNFCILITFVIVRLVTSFFTQRRVRRRIPHHQVVQINPKFVRNEINSITVENIN